jgi:4-hydroxy-3-polyprenylbenzoate decarboxylase
MPGPDRALQISSNEGDDRRSGCGISCAIRQDFLSLFRRTRGEAACRRVFLPLDVSGCKRQKKLSRKAARQDVDAKLDAVSQTPPLILGVSGASGARLGLRALQLFAASPDVPELHLVVSPRALVVAHDEVDAAILTEDDYLAAASLPKRVRAKVVRHGESVLDAPISSGSFVTRGMAVVPCSSGTLGSIAHGISRGLLQRAADVCLKERRRLVLAFRETPLSLVHAENIAAVTRAGAIVAPPVPAFYAARTAEEMLDAFLLRVADLLGVAVDVPDLRWKGPH